MRAQTGPDGIFCTDGFGFGAADQGTKNSVKTAAFNTKSVCITNKLEFAPITCTMGNAQSQGEKKVELAQKTGNLSLQSTGIEKVPVKDLATIPNLRVLDLSHNKLRSLPPKGLGKLTHLTTLTLDFNAVRTVPAAMFALPKLEKLSATHCALESLPSTLGSLQKLQKLTLAHNVLAALPESLGGCTSLSVLDLSHNRLRSLPSSLGQCAQLLAIDASDNALSALPGGLGGLSRLKDFDLRSNSGLKELPGELLADTPLHNLKVDDALLEPQGSGELRVGQVGRDAYIARRTARINKEIAARPG